MTVKLFIKIYKNIKNLFIKVNSKRPIYFAIQVDNVFSIENSSTCHCERLKDKHFFHGDIIVMIL